MDGSKKLKTQKRDSKGLSFLYYILKENRFIYKQKNNKMAENKRLLILGKSGGNGVQVQSDWAETNTESVSYIKNKPTISDAEIVIKQNNVTKGSFTLNQNGSATINLEGGSGGGSTQVQSDWAETNTESVSYIKNKPTLSIVATSGRYTDLLNKPTIPDAQVNSDWNASSGISQILNKPNMTTQTLTFVDENNVETNVVVYTQPTV